MKSSDWTKKTYNINAGALQQFKVPLAQAIVIDYHILSEKYESYMSIRRLSWFNSSRGVYPSLPCLEQAALLQDDIWSTWHICSNIKYFLKLFAGYLIIPFHIYFAWLKLTIWTAEIVLYETFRSCLIWQSYYCLIHFTKRCVSQPAMPGASSTSAGSYMVHLTYLF